jgi:4-diphosphocytidyl-2-C-methyl-D-erythritol kinase
VDRALSGADAVPDGPGWSRWPAPAKINLFLRITGRRADGFHDLQTVFQLLDWGDRIHLRPRSDGRIERTGASGYDVAEADDLVVRAAKLLQKHAKDGQGADILVEKVIPTGGGFGGGSSDAATVLVGLDALWGLGMGVDALAALGLQLGADVPVFVRGHSAWAEGVGEVLTPVALPAAAYLLVDSGVSVPTRELFQASELTRNAAPATIAGFLSGTVRGNAFEPVLRRLEPGIDSVLAMLSRLGEACLTGSGGGCFVRFATRGEAEAAQRQLPPGLRSWVAAGVARSPLLDALAATEA